MAFTSSWKFQGLFNLLEAYLGRLKLVLIYEAGFGEKRIAEIRDEPELFKQAKEAALRIAQTELEFLGGIDPVIHIDKELELKKKAKILNRLVPDGGYYR